MSQGAAIIGFAGRFPGAPSLDDLWDVVSGTERVTGGVPDDRGSLRPWAETWKIEAGFLDDVMRFDAAFFGIAPKEAKLLDPQQRLILQSAWHAIEDAGLTLETIPRKSGVFVGIISGDYGTFTQDAALDGSLPFRGTDHYQAANRISYHFDLHGPSIAVDTACSGSGVAIHQAMLSLEAGDCETAFVGGVNLFLHASRFAQFRQLGIISDDNCCRPFREGANGTVYGEGIGVMLLKPVERAIADGDNIRAIIKGSAINSGGKTQGFTVPSARAQSEVIGAALRKAGVSAGSVDLIEAHGTGTALGDPIEIKGLNEAFKADSVTPDAKPVPVGSIKGHIGHLESAAAIAGVAKIVLQMEHDQLAPSLPTGPANRLIKFKKTPFFLQDELTNWVSQRREAPHYALLSTFGAGGVNASIVVESPPKKVRDAEAAYQGVFPISARTADQLKTAVTTLVNWLKLSREKVCLNRLANTLQNGRAAFEHRLIVLADDYEALTTKLSAFAAGAPHVDLFQGTSVALLADSFKDSKQNNSILKTFGTDEANKQIAALWVNGIEIDWTRGRSRAELPQAISIPGYPFAGDRLCIDLLDRLDEHSDARVQPFSGTCVRPAFSSQVIFQTELGTETMPSLTHHRLFGRVVVPGSYYVALAATAARDLLKRHAFELHEVAFLEGLTCENDQSFDVQCVIDEPDALGHRLLRVASCMIGQSEWRVHFRANLVPDAVGLPLNMPMPLQECTQSSPSAFYELGERMGFSWSGPYRAIQSLEIGGTGSIATIECENSPLSDAVEAVIHPAALDAVFQVALASLDNTKISDDEAFMPLGIQRIRVNSNVPDRITSRFDPQACDGVQSERFNGVVCLDDGAVALEFEGLTVLRVKSENLNRLHDRAQSATSLPAVLVAGSQSVPNIPPSASSMIKICPLLQDDFLEAVWNCDNVQRFELDDDLTEGDLPAGPLNLIYTLQSDRDVSASNLAQQAESLIATIKRVLQRTESLEVRLWVLGFASDKIQTAGFEGLVRSLAWEIPALRPTTVVLDAPLSAVSATTLVTLIAAQPDEDQWAMSEAGLSVSRLKELQLKRVPQQDIRGSQSIVTGGASGLGLLQVRWLLSQGVKKVVVLGRSAEQPDSLKSLLDMHNEVQVIYRAVDVTDLHAVQRIFDRDITADVPLSYVLHAAGMVDDGAFTNLNRARFEPNLSVKGDGLLNLASSMRDYPAARLIAMSSATSLLGAPGQTNYSMANAIMDAVCDVLRADGRLVTNINWGPWKNTGMTARMAGAQARKATSGAVDGLNPENADQIFTSVFGLPDGQYVVIPENWRDFASSYGSGPLPSIWRTDVKVPSYQNNLVTAQKGAQGDRDTLDAKSAMTIAMRDVLGYSSPSSFDWNAAFTEIGIDSLSAVSLRDQLCVLTGVSLNTTIVYDFPTANRLVAHLEKAINCSALDSSKEKNDLTAQTETADVSELSEDEANTLLTRELAELGFLEGPVS